MQNIEGNEKISWSRLLMVMVASMVLIVLAPFAYLMAITNKCDAKDIGLNLKEIAELIVGMSKEKSIK